MRASVSRVDSSDRGEKGSVIKFCLSAEAGAEHDCVHRRRTVDRFEPEVSVKKTFVERVDRIDLHGQIIAVVTRVLNQHQRNLADVAFAGDESCFGTSLVERRKQHAD